MKVVKTVCNMCPLMCGIDVYVEKGKIVKVTGMKEHRFNNLCEKAFAIPELLHSPERLTNPLIRKINGEFREVTWNEALDFIADRLTGIKERYGAKAVVPHFGAALLRSHVQFVARRFSDLYGTPNFTTGAGLCYLARTIGHSLTCGSHLHPDCSADTKCMVVWGSNPVESKQPLHPDNIYAAAKGGARLIVIDPKATQLAKQADIHAQIRPGTDCALALGMLNIIIGERLYDEDFVERWTIGFDKLAEHVKEYSPERVEEITWVPADTIRSMAQMYATNKPAWVALGISMDHCTNGIQAIRAIATLIAITGNLDKAGGNFFGSALRLAHLMTNLRLEEKVSKDRPIGADYPLFTKYVRETTVTPLSEQILSEKPYPIKGLLIAGNNGFLTLPNTNKLKQGRGKLDLMMVIDIFMTDTAKMADIVLPGTSFLERLELKDYLGMGISLVTLANRVIEPIGNSMEDWRIWAELGKRMGYAEYFPWKDAEEIIKYLLEPTNISFEGLKKNPGGISYAKMDFEKYLKDGFNTPSKKVEIYSETLKEYGYDPLPTFHEPAEGPVSCPDLAAKYPLIFVSGGRTSAYTHSQYRNLPSLRNLVPEPLLEINPRTAHGLGLSDRDWVKVESQRGSIKLRAKFNEDIHPKTVVMEHGWSEANGNSLTDDEARDPISGYPGLRSVMCRVMEAGHDFPVS